MIRTGIIWSIEINRQRAETIAAGLRKRGNTAHVHPRLTGINTTSYVVITEVRL
jgi:hypothetical protein